MENTSLLTVSVSALNNYIKRVIDNNSYLKQICVKGEISNLKLHTSGHIYMTLKDEGSILRAVMFKTAASGLRFKPENGMKIIARGKISVYERDGQYQMYIEEITPDGEGALYVAFEKLKKELAAEGLFDTKHKKPLPKYPSVIGVVTAATGAAVRDIINVLNRRFPIAQVRVFPVAVQGENAAGEICTAIEYFNKFNLADVLIVGRGGGSIEDLWAFNEECVARAIFSSNIPIISAVGHEVDFTIADFVADLRAPTPSAAAEVCVPSALELMQMMSSVKSSMLMNLNRIIEKKKRELMLLESRPALKSFSNFIREKQIAVDNLSSQLLASAKKICSEKREKTALLMGRLDALSPLNVLNRGYSVALKSDGKVLRSIKEVKKGDELNIKIKDGELVCEVITESEQSEPA